LRLTASLISSASAYGIHFDWFLQKLEDKFNATTEKAPQPSKFKVTSFSTFHYSCCRVHVVPVIINEEIEKRRICKSK